MGISESEAKMQDQKLQDYFQFDEADLQANRSGVFSDKQKKELSTDQSSTVQRRRRAGAVFLGLGILLWLILIGFLIFKGSGYLMQNAVLLICPGPGGLVFLLASIFVFRSTGTVRENYQLKKVAGPVNIIQAEREIAGNASRHHFVHELHIGGVTFDVLPDLPNIMMQGDVYAAYYTEPNDDFSGRVWSAELVSKAN
jgi:hypothetical protein